MRRFTIWGLIGLALAGLLGWMATQARATSAPVYAAPPPLNIATRSYFVTATFTSLPPQPTTATPPTASPSPPTLSPTLRFTVTVAASPGAPTAAPRLHTVQRGETLFRIATRYGVDMAALVTANRIADSNQIYTGQQLLIPTRAPLVPAPTAWSFPRQTVVPPTAPVLAARLALTMTPLFPTPAPVLANATRPVLATLALKQPTAPPTATPIPQRQTAVNGVSIETIIPLPKETVEHIRAIAILGKALRRSPRAFSKLGDSIIEPPHFLTRFDSADYDLGAYAYLQPVIDAYSGSFARDSIAVRRGLHSWSVFDPMWADKRTCRAGEHVLACEIRVHNPSILFIRLGSNDVGVPKSFDANMRAIVEYCIEQGVIPVLSTKADRHEGSDINNALIRQIAADYFVPLWDFDAVAATIPDKGIGPDGTHLTTYYAHDWRSPVAFTRGHGLNNLTALIVLDAIQQALKARR